MAERHLIKMPSAKFSIVFRRNLCVYRNLINPDRQVGIGFCDPGFLLGLPTALIAV